MLRLYDTEGVDSDATVSFASGIRSAWSANLLEERDHDLALRDGTILLRVPAYSIETVGFVPGKLGRKMGRRALGAEAEPVQPVWVRSWEHDRESLPMGYEPVVCSISREVVEEEQGRLLRIKVNAVNDYTDASVCGAATLIVPEHWTVEPAEVPFELAPLGHAIAEVHVQRPEPEQRGQIKLRFEHDGQVFQDVLEIGGSFDLEMATENRGDEIVVTVRNPCSEPVEAEVALATPIEAWSSALVGDYALLDISPRSQGVGLAPKQTARLTFRVKPVEERNFERADSYWAVAKLMSNGRITLRRCDARRKRRTLDDEAWFDRYVKRTRRLYQWPK